MASFISTPSGSEFTVGAPCGAAGGAMYDPPSHTPEKATTGEHCFLIAAPPVIIAGNYMSMMQGFRHVNSVFRVNGDQPSVPTNLDLPQVRV